MTEEEIKKFQKRARHVATKSGYRELADDFAQEIFVEFLQNPDRGATVDQLFIDYLRRTHGRPGTPGGDARIYARNHTVSIDEWVDGESKEIQLPASSTIGDIDECSRYDFECSRYDFDIGRLALLFGGREAEIFTLYFVEHWTEKTIGKLIGVSESRVSQILKGMKKEIQNYYITQEIRERLEWDESFGVFQVNWIRL